MIEYIVAFFLPPLGVFLKRGFYADVSHVPLYAGGVLYSEEAALESLTLTDTSIPARTVLDQHPPHHPWLDSWSDSRVVDYLKVLAPPAGYHLIQPFRRVALPQ